MKEDVTELWRKRIIDCQNSNLTITKWCQQHQVAKSAYYYWSKKLNPGKVVGSDMIFAAVTAKMNEDTLDVLDHIRITWNQISVSVSSQKEAGLAAEFFSQLQRLC